MTRGILGAIIGLIVGWVVAAASAISMGLEHAVTSVDNVINFPGDNELGLACVCHVDQ